MENHVKDLLCEIAIAEGFQDDYSVHITGGIAKGLNFQGKIMKVVMKDQEKNIDLIVKCAPTDIKTRAVQKSEDKFYNEHHFYSTVLPRLQLYGPVPNVPKFYGSFLEIGKETIILQDVTGEGFRVTNFIQGFDSDHLKCVIKSLADLHSTSMAWNRHNERGFRILSSKFRENFFLEHPDKISQNILKIMIKGCTSIATTEAKFHIDELTANRMNSFSDNAYEDMLNWVNPQLAEPFAGITHGDSWGNNYLFKYKQEKPVDVVFVDWQMARLGSPILDVSYLIFSTGNEQCVRDAQTFFSYHNLRIGMTTRNYNMHLTKFARYGLTMALIVIVFAAAVVPQPPEKIMEDFVETSEFTHELNPKLSKRVAYIVKAACDVKTI